MKTLLTNTILVLAWAVISCSQSGGNLQVLAVFQSQLGETILIPGSVVKLRLTVSGPGMSDISREETVQESGTLKVGGVPAGSDRTVLLECLEDDDFVAWYGSTTTSVSANQDTQVTIDMVQVPAPREGEPGIKINADDEWTNDHIVTLTFNVERAAEYALGAGEEITEFVWHELPTGGVEFSLFNGEDITSPPPDDAEDGVQFVTVVYRDAAGQVSRLYTDQVELDSQAPSVVRTILDYEAGTDNPLSLVTKATIGTTVTVTVVSSELLNVDAPNYASLKVCDESAGLKFVVDPRSTGISTIFVGVVEEAEEKVDISCTPFLTVVDLAGNQLRDYPLSQDIEIKTTPVNLTVQQDLVTFVRSPYGNSTEEALEFYTIPAGSFYALAPADPLEDVAVIQSAAFTVDHGAQPTALRVWTDKDAGALIGTLSPNPPSPDNPDGSWPRQQLANLDTTFVWVTGLDAAGNESIPVKISTTEWIATTNSPEFGESPHEVTSSGRADEYPIGQIEDGINRIQETSVDMFGSDAKAILRSARKSWREREQTDIQPVPRSSHAMAYDSARGKVVLFGGMDTVSTYFQDTWEWDSQRGKWENATPTGNRPSVRQGHALAYDSVRGRTILFGGITNPGGLSADIWAWDGESRTWEELTPDAGYGPSARYRYAMAFDCERGSILLFGGHDGDGPLADTWEWDGESGTWQEYLFSPNNHPPARSDHAMAYDSHRGKVVLNGGTDSGGPLGDTWEWDGETQSWLNVTPDGDSPAATGSHAMTYDIARRRVVLFGQSDSSTPSETWEWDSDSGSWENVTPLTGDFPAARLYHALAYDSAHHRIVMFGGYTTELAGDTWEWDGQAGSWTNVSPQDTRPGRRSGHAMAYDVARSRVLLFGGSGPPGLLQDTWVWNGSHWSDVTPADTSPAPREGHALAFDGFREKVILFGGQGSAEIMLQDTWEWDGAAGDWLDMTQAGNQPPARRGHAIAYDSSRRLVVLFGGRDLSSELQDTWEWSGNSGLWTQVTPTGNQPDSRYAHRMAYDKSRERMVLFGGCTGTCEAEANLQDTWEFNGHNGTWQQVVSGGETPPARSFHAMAYDPDRGKVVLFAGFGERAFQDTWEWNGTSWIDVTTDGTLPSVRFFHAMAYDHARQRMVMFGGNDLQDTWEWDANRQRQPSIQLRIDMDAAGIEPDTLVQVSVRGYTGGVFYSSGAQETGATLYGWRTGGPEFQPGGWFKLGEPNAIGINPDQPYLPDPSESLASLISYTTSSPEEARQFYLEGENEMAFQVRPNDSSGADPLSREAKVALDFLEVRVRYRNMSLEQ